MLAACSTQKSCDLASGWSDFHRLNLKIRRGNFAGLFEPTRPIYAKSARKDSAKACVIFHRIPLL